MSMISHLLRPHSTASGNSIARLNTQRARDEYEQLSTELATGFKRDIAADLGMRSSESISLRSSMQRNQTFIDNNKLLENKLESQADIINSIRDRAQEFMNLSIGNELSAQPSATTLQQEAKAVMQDLINQLNSTFNGSYLFGGLETGTKPLNNYAEADGTTGQSPKDVIDGVVGGSITTLADANAKIADLDLAFSDNAVNPNDDFEASFYNGTPLYDGLGNPNPRLSAMTDYNKSIDYGIQSNDPSIREILKGVAMIASVDVTTINDTSAYQAWMGKAMASMADGIQNVGIAQAKLGKQQEYLSENLSRQQDKADIYNNRIVALEQVDPYEAATRLTALETQLNATYAVTSRVLKLTYLNYM